MPEESKKNQQKGKNDPKEQRRRRQGKQPAGPVEKKPEKVPERNTEKQTKEPDKPAYEPPGPEFYKSLKRETDEILKITEEANTKYKKKEIQSNWAKYEMPIETYDEIDEQENIGADYEKLIQASATSGSHFQFKHEKSWDTDSGPSMYDKYFDINMDLLSLAISTIPFYERNSLEQSMFNENDIMTMNHRATKYKQKYYNDKKYNTPELEAQDKILKSLTSHSDVMNPAIVTDEDSIDLHTIDNAPSEKHGDVNESSNITDTSKIEKAEDSEKDIYLPISSPVKEKPMEQIKQVEETKFEPKINTDKLQTTVTSNNIDNVDMFEKNVHSDNVENNRKHDIILTKVEHPKEANVIDEPKVNKQASVMKEQPKNPVIESPEDLEKWLDDFLDG